MLFTTFWRGSILALATRLSRDETGEAGNPGVSELAKETAAPKGSSREEGIFNFALFHVYFDS